MKKAIIVLLLASLILSLGLSGCALHKNESDNKEENKPETEETLITENTVEDDTDKAPEHSDVKEQPDDVKMDKQIEESDNKTGDEDKDKTDKENGNESSDADTDKKAAEEKKVPDSNNDSGNGENADNKEASKKETSKENTQKKEASKKSEPSSTQKPTNNNDSKKQNSNTKKQTVSIDSMRKKMLNLINNERKKAGAGALKLDSALTKVANIKAEDMVKNNYFAHTSPTYGDPHTMLLQFGLSYITSGENLAGYNTVESAHAALMKSSGHKRNILNQDFIRVGIGIYESPRYGYIFVQMFAGMTFEEYDKKIQEELEDTSDWLENPDPIDETPDPDDESVLDVQ